MNLSKIENYWKGLMKRRLKGKELPWWDMEIRIL